MKKLVLVLVFGILVVFSQGLADKPAGMNNSEKENISDSSIGDISLTVDRERVLRRSDTVQSGFSELDEAGGPDDFGYMYIDSNEPGGPEYEWTDIMQTGTMVTGWDADVTQGPFDIGFDFPYYENIYDEFYVCDHGYICFGDDPMVYMYTGLPDPQEPNNEICFFWMDLLGQGYNAVYYETIDERCVIQIDHPQIPAEIILHSNGDILIQYNTDFIGFDWEDEVIGIENSDGTIGLLVSEDDVPIDYPTAELALLFYLGEENASVSGNVTVDATGDPVVGAEIRFGGYTATTDDLGFYEIPEMYPNVYTVTVDEEGFYPYEEEGVEIVEGENTYDAALMDWGELEIDLDEIFLRALPGETDTEIMTISNTGASPLVIAISSEIVEPEAGAAQRRADFEHLLTNTTDLSAEYLYEYPSSEDVDAFDVVPSEPYHSELDEPYVLIFNDGTLPWGSTGVQDHLDLIEVEWDLAGEADLATWDLEPYTVIIILSEQSQTFYDEFVDNHDRFEDWVNSGGWLQYHGCTQGQTWTMFDGLAHLYRTSGVNWVVEPDHPICEGIPESFTGSSANHDYLINLPENAVTLIEDDFGDPVLIEYSYGSGNVVVTTETWEYAVGAGQEAANVMYNCINYTTENAGGANWLIIEPRSGIIPPGEDLEITVTGDATGEEIVEGLYEAIMTVDSDDPDNPTEVIPVTFVVGGRWVNGIVMDALDQPMENARVYFEDNPVYEAYTDETGFYSLLNNVPIGPNDIICVYPNYWPSEAVGFEILDVDTMTLNFTNENELAMVYPDGELETTALEIEINLFKDSSGTASFEIESNGTGPLDWDAYIRVINTPSFVESDDIDYSEKSESSSTDRTSASGWTKNNRRISFNGPFIVDQNTSFTGLIENKNELDEIWDVLVQYDVQSTTANDGIIAAVTTPDSIYISARYIDEEHGGNFLYTFNHQGFLFNTYAYPAEMLDSEGYGLGDLAYDPVSGDLFGANADGEIYQFSHDFSEYTMVTFVEGWPNALAYDWDNETLYLRQWGDNFAVLDVVSGEITTLAVEMEEYSVTGMAYMPLDEDGYTIWLAAHDGNGMGGYVFRYNPETLEYDTETLEVYAAEENSVIGGMDISLGWRADFYDITTVHQGLIDYVDIWEGILLPPSWIWLEPEGGVVGAGEAMNVTIHADLNLADDVVIEEGQEIYAEVYFNGPHWANTPVMDLTVIMTYDDVEEKDILPTRYALHQNYPNPFNPVTSIKFDLVAAQNVKLSVYNILGQEVAQLVNGRIEAGFHHISFEADHLASGVYFYSIETDAFTDIKKMIMVK